MKLKYIIPLTAVMLLSCTPKDNYDAQGTFEATEVVVAAEEPGKIMSLQIEQGDSLVAGMSVGLIDTLQLALQREELINERKALLASTPDTDVQTISLREQISGVATERDRIARLLTKGAAPQQQLDNLNTQLASLKGQLSAHLSTMNISTATINDKASAIAIRIKAINDKIAKCTITSPISGTVLVKNAECGELVSFGTPLFKIADMENMFLRAYFTSDQLSDIRVGQKVKVMADYGGEKQKEYTGTIVYIATQSEFTPKTVQTRDSRANLVYAVKIAVKNDGLLKLGLTGNVYVGNKNK